MSNALATVRTSFFRNPSDLGLAAAVVVVVAMMIIPLPTVVLDLLMALNLTLSIMVVLVVIYSRRAIDFASFPTVLLIITIFGLALNISSTRLILSKGSQFDGALVRAFSRFVVGSEGLQGLVIGLIIFIIIMVVQFVVITKGATRISEVSARFTLDAMPGEQMNIDGAYSSGAITEEEYKIRKAELELKKDFFGAMDGASKFVSGNVKAGLFITFVNVIGGFLVGMLIHGESFATALQTYVGLTIGDGLVSQLPALMVSTASGLIVTRTTSGPNLGEDIRKQFSADANIFWISAAILSVLAFLPGFPSYVLIPMAGLLGFFAFQLSRRTEATEALGSTASAKAKQAPSREATKEAGTPAPLDPLSLELGYGLIPLVDRDQGAELLDRITRIRREMALDLGLAVPPIHIIDNMRLEPSDYSFKIRGTEVGRGTLKMGHYLAINPGKLLEGIPGEPTRDPAFGLPATWLNEENREKAERRGVTVVDSPSIIATHLTEIIKRHAYEILGRQETQALLNSLKNEYSAVVEEAQKHFNLGDIQKVLQHLLREQVSIRNLVSILETMSDYGAITKDPVFLGEKVRQALGRQICQQYADEERVLHVLTLNPDLEQKIISSRDESAGTVIAALEPRLHRAWINAVANAFQSVQSKGYYPIILTSEAARALVRSSTEREFPELAVLSVPEIASGYKVEALGEINVEVTG